MGALGFLSRLPVGHDDPAWNAFRETPVAFPIAGYLIGALSALPLLGASFLSLPPGTGAIAYVGGVYALTGFAHVDGLADVGDAAAVHGDSERRRAVMDDAAVGAGGALLVVLVVGGLALAGLSLGGLPPFVAAGVIVAAEVGAKVGMATVACVGRVAHEGLGAAFVARADPVQLTGPVLVALPALILTWPSLAAVSALLAGPTIALFVLRWAATRLEGANGDVFGATNELGRVIALHLGVVTWTLA